MKSNLYVCPICGNVLYAAGSAAVSCCGISLPPLEAEEANGEHQMHCELVDYEYFISFDHPMEKNHYISFVAYSTADRFEMVKLYPEGRAEAQFFCRGHKGHGVLLWYCNRHGLFKTKI